MKKHLLTLALGMAPLAHADLSPTEIFESLAPKATAATPAAELSTLASIPADASLVLTLPQIPESLTRLQSLMGDEPLPAEFLQIASLVKSLSLGIDKDGTLALAKLFFIIGTLDAYELDNSHETNPDLKAIYEQELAFVKELKAAATQDFQALKLPTIYLVGEIDPKLTPQLEEGLAMLNNMMEKVQEATKNKIDIKAGFQLTGVKPIKHAGMAGYQFDFELKGIKKSYCLLQQIEGSTVRLIGTPDVAQLKLVGSAQESFLATSVGSSLAAGHDIHAYSDETDIVAKICSLVSTTVINRNREIHAASVQMLKAITAMGPRSLKGIRASVNLAGNPELQLAWQNDRYRFAPMAFKGASLIKPDAKRVHYAEVSSFNVPDVAPFFDATEQMTKIRDEYRYRKYHREEDRYTQYYKLADTHDAMNRSAYKLGWGTATGQFCFLEQSPMSEFELMVLGFKDKGIMQSAIEIYQTSSKNYQAALEQLSAKFEGAENQINSIPTPEPSLTYTDQAVLICEKGVESKQYTEATGGPTLSGALFMSREPNMKPFSGIYGRMDNVGENFTVKFQLRREEQK